jgi:hypothetical protein
VARLRRRYERAYVCRFVRPNDGKTFWLVLPRVEAGAFSLALQQFAEWTGAGEGEERVLMVLSRAGFRTGGEVEATESTGLEFLTARLPECAPTSEQRESKSIFTECRGRR